MTMDVATFFQYEANSDDPDPGPHRQLRSSARPLANGKDEPIARELDLSPTHVSGILFNIARNARN